MQIHEIVRRRHAIRVTRPALEACHRVLVQIAGDKSRISYLGTLAELAMLGYAPEEYVGRPIAEFHVDPPVIADILACLASGGTLDRAPARLRAKGGSIRHVEITSNGRIEDDKLLHTRCFTADVTQWHQAEITRTQAEQRQ